MDFVTGMKRKQVIMQSQMGDVSANQNIVMEGAIHNLRDMSDFVFIILRTYEGLVQCVASKKESYQTLREGMTVKVTGEVREEQRAPGGYELVVKQIEILSKPVFKSKNELLEDFEMSCSHNILPKYVRHILLQAMQKVVQMYLSLSTLAREHS